MGTKLRVAYRYLSGRPLDGKTRTDCGYLRPGTRALTITGRASRWAMLPGWKRQVFRLGIPTALTAYTAAYAAAPELTLAATGTSGATLATLGGQRAWRRWQLRRHTRSWTAPLAGALEPLLYPSGAPRQWLDVPLDVHREGAVRVELPGFVAEDRRASILGVIRAKLAMHEDVTAEWHYAGRDNHLTVQRLPMPPKRVGLDDARAAMLAAPESAPILGLGRRSVPVAVDLDSEAPHVLISAGSGGGKSVQTRAIVSQLMRNGAQVVFLDLKRQSHRWARNLPGVVYCRDVDEIHDNLVRLAAEGDRRNKMTDEIPDDVDTTSVDVGPRIVLVAEEMNATVGRLQRYWEETREKGDPKSSPAIKALGDILFMGRAVKIHVIAIAQLMTARSLGGPEARENFAVRILGRYSMNAWRMLCPEVWPMPKSSRHPGRVQVVIGGQAAETQVLFLSDAEARKWASGGDVTVPVGWETRRGQRDTTVVTPPEPLYGLREAVGQEWCTLGYDALRQRASRARRRGEWPAGKLVDGVEKWTAAELQTALGRQTS